MLAVGVGFGVAGVKPIPAIILAQALNGLLLPAAAVFLFWAVNDREIMGPRAVNGPLSNLLMGGVVAISILLGLATLLRVGAGLAGAEAGLERGSILGVATGLALLITLAVVAGVLRRPGA